MPAPIYKRSFTLIEMLGVIAIIAILISLLMPGLSRARERGHQVTCMANIRQLSQSHTLYTRGNDLNFPGCDTGSSRTIASDDWVQAGNTEAALTDGTLWDYVETVDVYRCPRDFRWDALSKSPTNFWRAYSVNAYLNGWMQTVAGESEHHAFKFSNVKGSPDQIFTFTEEQDPRGYNVNSFFVLKAGVSTWVNADWMAPLHLKGYNLSFLDGHSEYWQVMDPQSIAAAKIHGFSVPASNVDLKQFFEVQRAR
jgi:competence protein ComGC